MSRWGKIFDNPFINGITRMTRDEYYEIYRPGGMERWILNLTISGSGRVNKGHSLFQVNEGDLLLFPPKILHDYGPDPDLKEWQHLWFYFSPAPAWKPLLQWPQKNSGILGFKLQDDNYHNIRNILKQSIETFAANSKHSRELAVNLFEQALLRIDEINPADNNQSVDARITTAISYIKDNFHKNLKVSDIASQVNMSPSRFAHLFQTSCKTSPMKYVEMERIKAAETLLVSTEFSIAEIASSTGYEDPLYFSKVFKRVNNQSPSNFRENTGSNKT